MSVCFPDSKQIGTLTVPIKERKQLKLKNKTNVIPRVVAAHDMSGIGRCSLSVIIPVLSTMGIQVCAMPTALLSTHTGGFTDYTFHDLAGDMEGFIRHWKSLGEEFDCFYSGFVGSGEQMEIMERFLHDFSMDEKLIVIDPVFADNGVLYSAFTEEIIGAMRGFIRHAHIITPNITEASYLLGEDLCAKSNDLDQIKKQIRRLADFGPKTIVVTSMPLEDDKKTAIAYDGEQDRFFLSSSDYIPEQYPGTGDIFTSVMTGALLQGEPLAVAADRATQFVARAICFTYASNTTPREGVLLEKILPTVNDPLGSINYKII